MELSLPSDGSWSKIQCLPSYRLIFRMWTHGVFKGKRERVKSVSHWMKNFSTQFSLESAVIFIHRMNAITPNFYIVNLFNTGHHISNDKNKFNWIPGNVIIKFFFQLRIFSGRQPLMSIFTHEDDGVVHHINFILTNQQRSSTFTHCFWKKIWIPSVSLSFSFFFHIVDSTFFTHVDIDIAACNWNNWSINLMNEVPTRLSRWRCDFSCD